MQPLRESPDRRPTGDAGYVSEAAEHLQIREPEIFEHAHRWWFGREIDGPALEALFGAYLRRAEVPAWVRHYCRSVLRQAGKRGFDPRRFGVSRPSLERLGRVERLVAVLVVLAAFLVYLWVIKRG